MPGPADPLRRIHLRSGPGVASFGPEALMPLARGVSDSAFGAGAQQLAPMHSGVKPWRLAEQRPDPAVSHRIECFPRRNGCGPQACEFAECG